MVEAVRRTRGNPLNALLVLATAAVVFFAIYACQSANEFLYQAPPSPNYDRGGDFRFVRGSDGSEINVFWERGSESTRTVLYCCGTSEDLARAMPLLRSHQLKGFNVASFEYRSFGYTKVEPSQKSLYADSLAVFDFIVSEMVGRESNLVVHGHSLGGAIALEIATRREPGAVILESSFSSAYSVLMRMDWIPGDLYRNKAKAGNVVCPVLLIHGEADSVVPLSDAVDLANSFDQDRIERHYVPNGGHFDLRNVAGVGHWPSIEPFIWNLDSSG